MRWAAALPFVLLAGIGLPLLAAYSLRLSARAAEMPSARALAWQSMLLQGAMVALASLATWGTGIDISWRGHMSWPIVMLAVSVLAMGLALAACEARWRLVSPDPLRQRLRQVHANDPHWLAAVTLASVAEEYCYRGVLTALLDEAIGIWPAALLSAALFGAAHLGHGRRAAVFSMLFGFSLQVLCFTQGGLSAAIAVHFAYDMCVGAWANRRATRIRIAIDGKA